MPVCNAKNHPRTATADLVALRAKGSRSMKNARAETSDLFAVPKVPRRYTKANKRCAFCYAPVFFRRLANGRRVYFDDPGSPWRRQPQVTVGQGWHCLAHLADGG